MAASNDEDTTDKKLSRAETLALKQEAYKQKQKERVKAAKKAYLAKPEVQQRIKAQKDILATRRKAKSAAAKAARKEEKKALSESQKTTRVRRQKHRDDELVSMLGRASELKANGGRDNTQDPPKLTVIKGGKTDQP
jgi:hypothetical protein